MFQPVNPKIERPRIPTEREYREWQIALWATAPGHRSKNGSGVITRLANTLRRVAAL